MHKHNDFGEDIAQVGDLVRYQENLLRVENVSDHGAVGGPVIEGPGKGHTWVLPVGYYEVVDSPRVDLEPRTTTHTWYRPDAALPRRIPYLGWPGLEYLVQTTDGEVWVCYWDNDAKEFVDLHQSRGVPMENVAYWCQLEKPEE